jgi:hypothetical protein
VTIVTTTALTPNDVCPAPQSRAGRPEAAAAIWHWRRTAGAGDAPQRMRHARRRAALQTLVAALAMTAALALRHSAMGGIIAVVAVVNLGCALASPLGAYARLQAGLDAVGHMVGRVLTYALLVPLFYVFFLGFGLLLRRGRRDGLQRWFDPAAPTYWHTRSQREPSLSAYERQF